MPQEQVKGGVFMDLLLRELKVEDIPNVASVYVKAFEKGDWNEHWTEKDAEKRITEIVSSPTCKGIICVSMTEVVGCVLYEILTWHNGKQLEVKEIFVMPSIQGKGVGKKLLEHIELLEFNRGVNEIFLWTNKSEPLLEFYSKMGYRENYRTTQLLKTRRG